MRRKVEARFGDRRDHLGLRAINTPFLRVVPRPARRLTLYEGQRYLWYERHTAHGHMLELKAQGGSSIQTSVRLGQDAIAGHSKSRTLS